MIANRKSRNHYFRAFKYIGAGLMLFSLYANAQPVHVQVERPGGIEYGAGNSVGKGPECYIITPFHVIEGAGKNAITVTSRKNKRAKARVIKYIQDFDAALLKAQGNHNLDCPEDWDDGSGVAEKIDNAPFLISKKLNSNGRIEQNRLFVSGLTPETIELEPYDARNKLQEGDSGSSVYAGKRMVGMVVSVDTATGEVMAVSQRQLHGLFGADVLFQGRQKAVLVPFVYNRAENVYATSAAHDYLSERTPFELQESAARSRQQISKGELPGIPDGFDYVISGTILELTGKRVNNPDYKPEDNKEKKSSFKDTFLKSLKKSFTKKDESARYLWNYNVDIEIQVMETSSSKHSRNLERLVYQVTGDSTNAKEMQKSMIRKAVIDSMEKTFNKFGLPMN